MRFFRRSLTGLFLLSLTVGFLAIAVSVILTALQARFSDEPNGRPSRERVIAVIVEELVPGPLVPVLTSFGEVQARRSLDLRAPVGGRIVALSEAFVEGGQVTAGDVLARIDPAEAETALAVARTDLAEAEADLRDAERSLSLARDELEAAEAQADLQARALARQTDLLERGVGSASSVEAAELTAAASRQAVLARRQSLAQSEARIDQAGTLIERRKIALADAERRLSETTIHAEFDGRLADVSVLSGGLVAVNEKLGELIDPTALDVAFRVSTAQYMRLLDDGGALTEAPVEVQLDGASQNAVQTARLIRESPAAGEGTTGRLLFAEIAEAGGLRPGDFVTVRLSEPELQRVVKVPASAVDARGSVLVVDEDDRLREEPVELLRRQGDDVILRVGALAGREIVIERSPLLGEGIRIRPIRRADETDRAAAEPELLELDEVRRAKLIAFVEANSGMPEEVKARLLGRLAEPQVPAAMVARLEARMGS